jgi:hypothetical protein
MLTPARVLAAAAMILMANAARADIIFTNDFSANANGFTGTTTIVVAPNGETFLGPLTQGAFTSLALDTSGYSSVTLNFDLYGILSLDGNNPGSTGQDFFDLTIAGGPVLLHENFSNFVNYQNNPASNFQSYGPNPSNPGRTGSDAALYGHLGYFWANPEGGDTTYHLSYTFAPTGNSTTIVFTGLSNQSPSDEYFGIDNVVVAAVPEPATLAMMILGFGAVRRATRR